MRGRLLGIPRYWILDTGCWIRSKNQDPIQYQESSIQHLVLGLLAPLSSLLLAFILACACSAAEPSAPQLNDKTFWFGNTWGGGTGASPHFMQMTVDDFALAGERIFAICNWDERGSEVGVYSTAGEKILHLDGWHSWGRRGGPAAAADDQYAYLSIGHDPGDGGGKNYSGVARYTLDGKPAGWPQAIGNPKCHLLVNENHKQPPTGLAVHDGELFVSDPSADRIRVFKTADLSLVRDMPFKSPGRIAVDAGADLWVIDISAHAVRKIKRTAEPLNVQISDCEKPVALCLDQKGNLLVADSAVARQQIRSYKTADGSHLAGSDFGSPIYMGDKPGVVAAGKFYRITSIRMDAQGNLYVGCWDYGGKIHKFDANRKQTWVLKGLEFVSCADADPGEDTSIYSPGHRYVIDYAKPPGQSWTEAAITVDPKSYPNDPRVAREAWMAMRMYRIENQKLMLGKAQMGAELYFWRFKGEIAVPAAMYFQWGAKDGEYPPNHPKGPFFWSDTNGDGDMQADEYTAAPTGSQATMIDIKGNLWVNTGGWEVAKGKITKVPFAGLNKHGAPTWAGDKATSTPIPADTGIKHLSKLTYDALKDRMYLAVWTEKHPFPGGGWEQMSVGPVVQCFENWSKTPKLAWEQDVVPPEGTLGKVPKAWSFETDYGFIAYTWKQEQIAVDVYRLSDGKRMGRLLPTADIGGVTGWIDMNDAVQTHRRADGTYVVFVEEVWMAKGLYFLWKP